MRIRAGSSSSEPSIASDLTPGAVVARKATRRVTRRIATTVAVIAFAGSVAIARPAAQSPVRVLVQTELGDIVLEVDTARAPGRRRTFFATSTPVTSTAALFTVPSRWTISRTAR